MRPMKLLATASVPADDSLELELHLLVQPLNISLATRIPKESWPA